MRWERLLSASRDQNLQGCMPQPCVAEAVRPNCRADWGEDKRGPVRQVTWERHCGIAALLSVGEV